MAGGRNRIGKKYMLQAHRIMAEYKDHFRAFEAASEPGKARPE
jgi:hypothetical protein